MAQKLAADAAARGMFMEARQGDGGMPRPSVNVMRQGREK
jgi:hypothetical protein